MTVLRLIPNPMVYLPLGVRLFLRRRAVELTGIAMMAATAFSALAIATWSSSDPSFNNATGIAPTNWLGFPGAATADLLLQSLGLGAVFLILPFAAWGWRLTTHRDHDRPRRRALAWGLAVVSAALFFGLLPIPGAWPLSVGMGGLLGNTLANLSLSVTSPLLGAKPAALFCAAIAGPMALGLLGFALNLDAEKLTGIYGRLLDRLDERTEARTYRQTHNRRDIEPGRLRIIGYWIADRLSDWRDRLLRRGDYRPLSTDERDAIKLGEFGRRTQGRETDLQTGHRIQVSRSAHKPRQSGRMAREAQPTFNLNPSDDHELPSLNLLTRPRNEAGRTQLSDEALQQNARLLESVLDDFGIRGEIINVRPGPVVTLYELEPAPGIKSSRVHERRLRPRRRRARPQRHRHRVAERAPRDGFPARASFGRQL